jgi:hypothetical protein
LFLGLDIEALLLLAEIIASKRELVHSVVESEGYNGDRVVERGATRV